MPFALSEVNGKLVSPDGKELISLDPAKPPVKTIPHMDFPRVVYLHPAEPFVKREIRNTQQELVNIEVTPSEHLTKDVGNDAELRAALEDGWVKEPYIPEAPPDPRAELYKRQRAEKKARESKN